MARRAILLSVGARFGQWTIIKPVPKSVGGQRHRYCLWFCRCACGTERWVNGRTLRTGKSLSCGCQRENPPHPPEIKNHPRFWPTHRSWRSMTSRVRGVGDDHKRQFYFDRGIRLCDRWSKFLNFWEDMGPRPIGMTLDRIDNNGDYEPGNCRWATKRQQQNNTRDNVLVIQDEAIGPETIANMCRRLGLRYSPIHHRLYKGWSLERAVSTPIKPLIPRHRLDGE